MGEVCQLSSAQLFHGLYQNATTTLDAQAAYTARDKLQHVRLNPSILPPHSRRICTVIFAMELCTARTSRTSDRCLLLLSIPGGCSSSMEADCAAVIAGADSRRRCLPLLPLLPLLLLLLLLPMVACADETANTQRAVGHIK
eukprot:COSAG01_NODE_341_length_18611_cov_31.251513_2_plen_142_part_00